MLDQTTIAIPEGAYKSIWTHLLPKIQTREQSAFIFADTVQLPQEIRLEYRDWYGVSSSEYVIQSEGHIELSDETRATVIKKAHDLKASLIELHSHLYSYEVSFSWSDIMGLKEFVPHVMWRLKGRPYAAIVVATSGFDALVWRVANAEPETLTVLHIGKRALRPTGATHRKEDLE